MMPGVQFGEFQNALVDAFDEADLAMMLRVRLNQRLDAIVKPGPFRYIVFQLLEWADCRGEIIAADLARAAYLERPLNEKIRRIYEKFGMAPPMTLQESGIAIPDGPRHVTANGLEAIMSPRLRSVDIDIWREKIAKIEAQVCRVELDGNPVDTGFLVGPALLLTNYHVLEAAITGHSPAARFAYRFDYKTLADGSRSEGVVVRLHDDAWCVDASRYSQAEADDRPDIRLPTADELDFALARLSRPIGDEPVDRSAGSGAPQRGWITVSETPSPLEKDMPLMIVQHPDGGPLKLALDTRAIIGVNANGTRVRYATNTEHCSSGSPCFDMDWTLVALHHMGDPAISWRGASATADATHGTNKRTRRRVLETHEVLDVARGTIVGSTRG